MLKFCFLLITLANLVFLLWEFQYGAFLTKKSAAIDTAKHSILLVSEATAQTPSHSKQQTALSISQKNPDNIESTTPLLLKKESDKEEKTVSLNLSAPAPTNHQKHEAGIVRPVDEPETTTAKITPEPDVTFKVETAHTTLKPKNIPEKSLTDKPRADNDEKTAASGQSNSARCFEKQVFESRKAAERWLKEQSSPGTIQQIEQSIPSTYLVYIPAAENYTLAKQTVRNLQEKGIEDFWLFHKGPLKNAISLGLFVKKYRAEKLVKQLLEKGIEVKLEIRHKSIHRWLAIVPQKKASC